MKINGKEITHKMFAYDGCHKIYLIDNEKHRNQAVSYGYDILPIELIEEIYLDSCELRFINTWGDTENDSDPIIPIVKQFEKAKFEF